MAVDFMSLFLINNRLDETSTVLRIRGPDAYTYLQGQFTEDLNHPVGATRYGLWLNQRGKVVADSFILRRAENDFTVASFSTPAGLLRQRLESYIIADEVEVADETGDWAWLRVWDKDAAKHLGAVFGSTPDPGRFVENQSGLVFRGRISGGERFEWLAPRVAGPTLAEKLASAGAQATGPAIAERARILSGIPAVPADIGPGDLPNEGGLEETAICHTKGCYLGQEVMARLKNLGQVRRRLHILRGPGAPPAPHTSVHQGGARIGETRSAAPDGDGFVAMAMLTLLNLDPAARLGLGPAGPSDLEVIRRV